MTLSQDVAGPAARLARSDLGPAIPEDAILSWLAAGRGLPTKVNLQDEMPVFLLTAARANPYSNAWYQRQEVATDLWT